MALLGWLIAAAIVGLIAYALYQKLEVKVGLRTPIAEFSFEAKDRDGKATTKQN